MNLENLETTDSFPEPLIKNAKIVIVDVPFVAEMLGDWFQMCINREVFLFENSAAAWKYIQNNHVDMVLSGVELSGFDGLTLLRYIKSTFPEIITICMSGNDENIPLANKLGVDVYLRKPHFRLKDIAWIVKNYISGETPSLKEVNILEII